MIRPTTRRALVLAVLLLLPLSAQAQDTEAPKSGPLTDAAELEAFLDGLMAGHMRSREIASATVSVVQDGDIFFAKGYGWADREKRLPVLPEATLFRPGSISKLFTWTSVMQLAERGELDLDADVNEYLKSFQIPATYSEPVTLKHLLTHTAGFEDGMLGYLFVKDAEALVPLADSLRAHVPARVRPPGTYAAYSNWGTALAGLIVANVSGLPFEEYVEKNIFEPLGMELSSFREPLPQHLEPLRAIGYQRQAGAYTPQGFEYIGNFGPAGSLSSCATDMARFMIAHLQLGRYGEARILEEDTARMMQTRLHTFDPRLAGMAHGFYETLINGQRVIGHDGDTSYFHSKLALFPEHGVGLFVSYVANGSLARFELLHAFVERYFPVAAEPPLKAPEDFAERARRYAGTYRFMRHNHSTLEKLLAFALTLSIAPGDGDTLVLKSLLGTTRLVEVEPLFFREVDGWQTVAFEQDDNGEITHLGLGIMPPMPAYRVPWYATPAFTVTLLLVGALLFFTQAKSAWRHRKATKDAAPRERWATRLAAATSVLSLVFLAAFLAVIAAAGNELIYGVPASLGAVLVLPILSSLLTVATTVFAVLAWKERYWTVGRRLHYTLFAVFALGYVWFYSYWNLLGFQY